MEIHKTLGIPILSHHVPYATAVSCREHGKVCFTLRGVSSDSQFIGTFLLILTSLSLWAVVYQISQQGLSSTTGSTRRYGSIPAWGVLVVVVSLLFYSLVLLFKGTRRIQLIVDTASSESQIQYGKTHESEKFAGMIVRYESDLVQRASTNTTLWKPIRWKKPKRASLVMVQVGDDAVILGAFKSIEFADAYTRDIQQQTALPVIDMDDSRFDTVAGFWGYAVSEKRVLSKPQKMKPVKPIEFR